MFRYGMRNKLTQDRYEKRLDLFLKYIGCSGSDFESRAQDFYQKARADPEWAESSIITYLDYQKKRADTGEISVSSLSNYYKPIKLFCEMNRINLSWKLITRGLPRGRGYANDRAPTIQEIQKILEYPDRRIKPIVLVAISSGIRDGAWDYLRWRDVIPLDNEGNALPKDFLPSNIAAAKLIVYRGEPEQYTTFITPEAYKAVWEYIEFRKRAGEVITDMSPLLRDRWDSTGRRGYHNVNQPRLLRASAVKRIIEKALVFQGIRQKLPEGRRRHEFQATHGFRKFFKSTAESVMKTITVERLMGHSQGRGIGLNANYDRRTELDLFKEYLQAVPALTVGSYALQEKEGFAQLKEKVERLERIVEQDRKVFRLLIEMNDDGIKEFREFVKKGLPEVSEEP
jgi:hypothetical protein